MSKAKKSKLDQFAERLDGWFGVDKKTIAEVQEQLKLDGCAVSSGRLSEWWKERQLEILNENLLKQITSGARQVKEVEAELRKNPAPQTDTLISLVRVLIMKFSTQANATPEMSEIVFNMLKPVIKWHELQVKEGVFNLDRQRFQRETCELFLKWYEDKKAKEIASDSTLSYDEKLDAIYKRMFNEERRASASPGETKPA